MSHAYFGPVSGLKSSSFGDFGRPPSAKGTKSRLNATNAAFTANLRSLGSPTRPEVRTVIRSLASPPHATHIPGRSKFLLQSADGFDPYASLQSVSTNCSSGSLEGLHCRSAESVHCVNQRLPFGDEHSW